MKKDVGDIDILINNAGIVTGKKFMDSPDSLIQKTMAVNTMAPFWVGQGFKLLSRVSCSCHYCPLNCVNKCFLCRSLNIG